MLRIRSSFAFAFFLCALFAPATLLAQPRWRAHDFSRPRPPVVTPPVQNLPVAPPSDAVVLFDGTSMDNWQAMDGTPTKWIIKNGNMEAVPGAGYIRTKQGFGDIQLHVEWAAPVPARGTSQGRGNSGVFLMGLYEVQVLDSYQNDTYPDGQAGAIYGQYPPLANVTRPPGEWQSYDIVFRRPRFNSKGELMAPARITVMHNNVLIQDNVEVWGPTEWLENKLYTAGPDRLPLAFQDHGNPVLYRNIWLRELDESAVKIDQPFQGRAVAFPDAVIARYLGTYQGTGNSYEIGKEGDHLYGAVNGRKLNLTPHSLTTFALDKTGGEFVFDLDAEGRPTGVTFHMGGGTYTAKRVN
ncbi:MAG: DUF1080 domain-containing protein [Rhodothermales bacterium]